MSSTCVSTSEIHCLGWRAYNQCCEYCSGKLSVDYIILLPTLLWLCTILIQVHKYKYVLFLSGENPPYQYRCSHSSQVLVCKVDTRLVTLWDNSYCRTMLKCCIYHSPVLHVPQMYLFGHVVP